MSTNNDPWLICILITSPRQSYPPELEEKLSASEGEIKFLRSKVDDLKAQLDSSQKEAASYRGRLENAESQISHLVVYSLIVYVPVDVLYRVIS